MTPKKICLSGGRPLDGRRTAKESPECVAYLAPRHHPIPSASVQYVLLPLHSQLAKNAPLPPRLRRKSNGTQQKRIGIMMGNEGITDRSLLAVVVGAVRTDSRWIHIISFLRLRLNQLVTPTVMLNRHCESATNTCSLPVHHSFGCCLVPLPLPFLYHPQSPCSLPCLLSCQPLPHCD